VGCRKNPTRTLGVLPTDNLEFSGYIVTMEFTSSGRDVRSIGAETSSSDGWGVFFVSTDYKHSVGGDT
jgi:hypothetical protein